MNKFLFIFVIVFCETNTSSLYINGPNRILHGTPANNDQFRYMISLQQLSEVHSNTRGHRCGGVLVTLQHALTAAYCTIVFDSGQMIPINQDEYRVFGGGAAVLTNDTSADRVRRIANIVVHPEYNVTRDRFLNDIAVIILSTPFLSNTATPLSVRDIGYEDLITCEILGWGMSTQLTYATLMIHNQTMCDVYMTQPVPPSMMCGWHPGHGSYPGHIGCPGDEGGPLVCQGELAGLISDIRGCTAYPPRPHLYVRVSSYSAWIDRIIEFGPDLTTVPPPTTTSTTTSAPGAASLFQPEMTLLAVITVVQIIF